MSDTWSDNSGCWADVYDDDHEEMQACEGIPTPSCALGLCAMHEAELHRGGTMRGPTTLSAQRISSASARNGPRPISVKASLKASRVLHISARVCVRSRQRNLRGLCFGNSIGVTKSLAGISPGNGCEHRSAHGLVRT